MNKNQKRDANKCEKMSINGEEMDCLGCSCRVCLAQVPDYTYLLKSCYEALTEIYTEDCALIDELKMVLNINR